MLALLIASGDYSTKAREHIFKTVMMAVLRTYTAFISFDCDIFAPLVVFKIVVNFLMQFGKIFGIEEFGFFAFGEEELVLISALG